MADGKDRRSGMANSSVKGQPKKDGAGGTYTWGKDQDVTDFEGHRDFEPGVQVVPAADDKHPTNLPQAPFELKQAQFPSLGATPTPVRAAAWGPSSPMATTTYAAPVSCIQTAPATSTAASYTNIRSGVVFDGQHPRNTFAAPAKTTVIQSQTIQPSIDWSDSGLPKQNLSSIIKGSSNAAHISPYSPTYNMPKQIPASVFQATQLTQSKGYTQAAKVHHNPPVQRNYATMSRANYGVRR
eukprot:gnl/TRDRNA2_/TRDRNA2_175447_c1_seq1.p1 gnl/TRDRNA2_/TRDRNA2_175447_c1~~gnl/TRDRNA2_/TRDRNA2_175447_c1_seq1.p1  ORF type:complete len:240 (+),score=39.13 gnl/TRDRNA2_/TRDRNA2_175447_c1_seq1:66-785(+)